MHGFTPALHTMPPYAQHKDTHARLTELMPKRKYLASNCWILLNIAMTHAHSLPLTWLMLWVMIQRVSIWCGSSSVDTLANAFRKCFSSAHNFRIEIFENQTIAIRRSDTYTLHLRKLLFTHRWHFQWYARCASPKANNRTTHESFRFGKIWRVSRVNDSLDYNDAKSTETHQKNGKTHIAE